jgi:hypothetical protein
MSGNKIPQNEPHDAHQSPNENVSKSRLTYVFDKLREHYLIITIVFGCIVVTFFVILFIFKHNQTQ